MATSNRDRINQMFELMAPPLDEFITGALALALPGDATWDGMLTLHDKEKGFDGSREYSTLDPQAQLKMITENVPAKLKKGWYPFSDVLGRVGQSYTIELRDTRNAWAHNESFTDDDTYRALDTGERLMSLVGAPGAADEIKDSRQSLRRLTAGKADKKVL